jgi:surface protein
MSSVFGGARSLSDISPVTNWNTSSATDMRSMFSSTAITDTDVLETGQRIGIEYISWDTSSVANMSGMFRDCASLVNISKIASWDVSSVADMSGLFGGASALSDISAIAAWNTASITDISSMLAGTAITSAEALRTMQHDGKSYVSWDMSNVESMNDLFHEAAALMDISALATWDISNVTNIGQMFCAATSLSDISAIANWNTSSVKEMYGLFRKATSLSSIASLTNWDTSNVENMRQLFYLNSAITDLSAIKYWNTSRVKQLGYAFSDTRITDVNALRTMQHEGKDYVSWDVSNVTDVICTFEDDYWLTDISALDSWNIQSGAGMTRTFNGVPATPLPDWYNE